MCSESYDRGRTETAKSGVGDRSENLDLALRRASRTDVLQAILQVAAAAQREPRVDQMSTLVRIFSTTASVNSEVEAWPPRSSVLTPPAVVSSTLS